MKTFTISFLFLCIALTVSAATIPNECYTTVDNGQFCTHDNLGKIQVLVFNAGWCPPCNQEMGELSEAYPEFANSPVVFASLSGEGWNRGAKPDQQFLKEWKEKHGIPFVVAGKYKDFGKNFGATGSIPFAVIVDAQGNTVKKGYIEAPSVVEKVRELLRELESPVDTKAFFESILGTYHIESIVGREDARLDIGEVKFDPDLPNAAYVSMPYCKTTGCFDSGNIFDFANTKVFLSEGVYKIEYTGDKKYNYEWRKGSGGEASYKNLQFIDESQKPYTLTHTLKKQ